MIVLVPTMRSTFIVGAFMSVIFIAFGMSIIAAATLYVLALICVKGLNIMAETERNNK